MLFGLIIIHWLHVLFGIFWFGSVLYRSFVLLPSLSILPPEQHHVIGKHLKEQTDAIILPVALTVIGLGIVRGTVVGPIQSTDVLLSNYGITWMVGLVLALIVFGWDFFVVGGVIDNLYNDEELWDGPAPVNLGTIVAKHMLSVRNLAIIEILGFLGIFTCMILMRFGY